MLIDDIYAGFCNTKSDINEHIPTLSGYAHGKVVTEFGVRKGVSTAAFLAGRPKKLTSYDINITRFNLGIMEAAKQAGLDFALIQADVLDISIEPTDILFIDTLHTYDQLIQELALHSEKVRDRIILHDTVSFRHVGEQLKGMKPSMGLYPAVTEFLETGWEIVREYKNNNGLMILGRT